MSEQLQEFVRTIIAERDALRARVSELEEALNLKPCPDCKGGEE